MIEITRTGDASTADLMSEMNEWLREMHIRPLQLEPVHVEGAEIRFRAIFPNSDEAERFCRRFDEEAARALT
jgi:hypothetical protein